MNPTLQTLPDVTEDEAFELGVEAWTYAFPLVLMELTRRVMTNVDAPDSERLRAPMSGFSHASAYPDATFRDVVRPNADTLYSMLWFDVGDEPLVLTVPDCPGRYHVLPLMDMWTDVFATLGTRSTGGAPGRFAIVGPRWRGTLPADVRQIESPTDSGWIIGRVQTNGPADFDHVRKIQAKLHAQPLSAHPSASTRSTRVVDPAIDMATPPVDQAMAMPADAFFALAAELMKRNPPHASDGAMVLRMERLGFVAGRAFTLKTAPQPVQRGLERAVPAARHRMLDRGTVRRVVRNGWIMPAVLGVYGNEYLPRAYIAYRGLGALPPEEAIYSTAQADGQGQPLDGVHRYRLHFDRDRLPPVHAFWSFTMYGADQFFVANPIDRFAIGDRDALKLNADGSLSLFVQHETPAADLRSNWLPAPAGPFSITARLYAPKAQALDGGWTAPPLERLP